MIQARLVQETSHLAKELARQLEKHRTRIVFAESCTAGLVSAVLGQVPGISNWMCGSAVTYRGTVKQDWLNIPEELIETYTAVSPQVTQKMAESVLSKTPEASFSVAITGHLEPQPDQPGLLAYVGLGIRLDNRLMVSQPVCYPLRYRSRINRQWEAARAALHTAIEHLRFPVSEGETRIDWYKVLCEPINYHWNPWI